VTATTPCVKLCVIDPTSGLCRGCRRTLDEIAAWSRLDEAARRRLMATLAARRLPADHRQTDHRQTRNSSGEERR